MREMSEPIVLVRTGVRDDYEAVAALQREIQEAHWRAAPGYFQPPSPETLTRATFDGWLADADRELLVLALAGRVIGYAWLIVHAREVTSIRPAMRVVEIGQLGVTASERGHGYGRRLLDEIDARARARKADAIELTAWLFNRDAIDVYERHGFAPLWQRMSRPL